MILIASACLLYVLARRLQFRPAFAAFAVGLFTLSPLALHYQRMVLLDNIAVGWLLASLVLALSPGRKLWSFALSGICLACAVLTKETFLLFLPAVALALRYNAPSSTRRFALTLFAGLFALIGSFYPVFAVLRGELLEGAHHTSLMYGIHFQLSRQGGGSLFNGHSATRTLVDTWLHADPILVAGGLLLLPLALSVRRLRAAAVGLAIPILMILRPGTYVPAMYVIGVLPFASLVVAGTADWLWQVTAGWWVSGKHHLPGLLTAPTAYAGRVLALAFVAALAATAAPKWVAAATTAMGTDAAAADRDAVAWLETHASRNSRLLVDDTVWTDLVDRGFNRRRTIWFYKLDLDPAVRIRWTKFDYVVRSNLLAGNLYWLPRSRQVFDHSRVVAVFDRAGERVEIRRVIKPPLRRSAAGASALARESSVLASGDNDGAPPRCCG